MGLTLGICLKTIGEAFDRARAGEGPQLVVARLLRLCGHGEHDDSHYIAPDLKNSTLGRDCLKVAEEKIDRTAMGGCRSDRRLAQRNHP